MCRAVDSKDLVEVSVLGQTGEGGGRGGSVESQEGDDELIINVRLGALCFLSPTFSVHLHLDVGCLEFVLILIFLVRR